MCIRDSDKVVLQTRAEKLSTAYLKVIAIRDL